MVRAGVFHQMIGRGPVAMAIEQRADDSAVQDSGKRLVFLLRLPFSNDLAVFDEAANMQTLAVRWTATEAGILGSVLFLKRFFHL